MLCLGRHAARRTRPRERKTAARRIFFSVVVTLFCARWSGSGTVSAPPGRCPLMLSFAQQGVARGPNKAVTAFVTCVLQRVPVRWQMLGRIYRRKEKDTDYLVRKQCLTQIDLQSTEVTLTALKRQHPDFGASKVKTRSYRKPASTPAGEQGTRRRRRPAGGGRRPVLVPGVESRRRSPSNVRQETTSHLQGKSNFWETMS